MDGSTVGLILAGVGVCSGLIGTIVQTRNNTHSHGKTAGVVEEGLRNISQQVTTFKSDVDKRFENVEKEQDQQWESIRESQRDITAVQKDVSYLQGKANGKGHSATI